MPPPAALLRAGKCTGALTYPGADGVRKLQVRLGSRGRGLFAADHFNRGEIVTTIAGKVIDNCMCESEGRSFEVWHISKYQCFIMNYALLGADSGLGILANTAGGSGMHFVSHQLLLLLLNFCCSSFSSFSSCRRSLLSSPSFFPRIFAIA